MNPVRPHEGLMGIRRSNGVKIIFFGTSKFAVPSLKKIMKSRHEVAAVVTQPDRKRGRKLVVASPPVKMEMKDKGIPIHQPQDVASQDALETLRRYNADLFLVVAFGQILKKDLLKIPKLYCVNLHASLLPKYRGASPINRAITNGDKKTGVTTIKMDEKMDRGDIMLRREVDILDEETSQSLSERLSNIGAGLLLETIELVDKNEIKFIKQDEKDASYAYKLKKEDGLIDWAVPAREIHNRVRGLAPWPGAYTHWKGKLLKIYKSAFDEDDSAEKDIGAVVGLGEDTLLVGTRKGRLIIKELQLEGGKRMSAGDFLRGHGIKTGNRFK
ncbi:MAG: methionyl-tRNA formyltransferase [Candidatus Omnitrophica bacterium]|nr:methionyl-tRNA formyltransferase [Candidatus Omnitrophota bacterium]